MTKISLLAAALALVAMPACKKKDADAPKTETPPATGSGSGATAPKPTEAPKPVEAAKPKTPQEIADMYKACGEKLNGGKLDDFMKDCVADDFQSHMGDMSMKKDELKGMFAGMRTAFPDMKWAPQLVLVNGHSIVGVALSTGTHEGTMKMPGMPDIPATHKKYGQLAAHRLKVGDDGKAHEEVGFEDMGTFMSQLGLAPKDAEPKRPVADKGIDGAPILAIAADDPKEKANVELVKKTDDAFNAHKIADVLALVTDDAVESDQASPKDNKGKKEIEKGLKEFQTAFSDGKITSTEMWGAGDYVVDIAKFEGTNDHDMGKMKKTGKKVSVQFLEVDQIKDGKVSHMWRFYDGMEFAKQLGLVKPPAGAPAAGGDAGKPGEAGKPGDKPGDKKDEKKPDDKKPAAPPAKK